MGKHQVRKGRCLEQTARLNINVCSVLLGTPGLATPVLCVVLSHHEGGLCARRREPVYLKSSL